MTIGKLERSREYQQRFDNLNKSSHNYLRITRILKCLGEFGFEEYKVSLIRHLLFEAVKEKTLPNILDSCILHWIPTVKSATERNNLIICAKNY